MNTTTPPAPGAASAYLYDRCTEHRDPAGKILTLEQAAHRHGTQP